MKQLLLFLCCLTLMVFASCNNSTSKQDRLKQAVSEFNKKETQTNLQSMSPERYVEIQTDSIISQTFKVSIKNYSNMNQSISAEELFTHKSAKIKMQRVFESDIIVSVKDQVVFAKHISSELFRTLQPSAFWENATLEHVWVNQERSDATTLSLGISMVNPKNKAFKMYEMIIDQLGHETLHLIEENS